ncbi:MAG: ABC transporter ATP-binding protein [Clostridia bacterium]|nr:ABC transporter ATP-binding protein [Clostridia bacterium]
MKNTKKKGTLSKVFTYIGRYRPLIFLSALLALITVALTLYIPILIGDAINLVVGKGEVDFDGVFTLLIKIAVLIGATFVFQWLMGMINNRVAYHVSHDMRRDAFEKIEKLPLSYIDTHSSGDTVSRIIADVDQFSDGLLLGFSQLFVGIITIIGTLAFMIALRWQIALVVVCLTPISLFIARFISSRTHSMFVMQTKTRGEQTALINEMVTNRKVVIAYSKEGEVTERFDEINARLEKYSLSAIFFSSLTNPTTRFVNSIVYAAVALTGALTAIATAGAAVPFEIGQLSCMLAYTNQYTKPFNEISGIITEFQGALACAARIFELIEEESEIPDAPDAVVLTGVDGNVAATDVSFSYDKNKRLLYDMNISVKPGQRVAIVGPTGCGKTTLINLLMRFYDVDGGVITVEGEDIRRISRKSLRGSYGMVLQQTWLKSGTVKENIAMGKPDATDEEIIEAAKAAHAHGFIKRLPNGYDTVIGDGGDLLSQGERQLLCISRVMLSLPPMLILDEATSSIDTRTEMRIQKAFLKMMHGRTSFIVAHRLSTIKEADVILVMKDGRIIEQGSHDELIAKGGFYNTLYNSQFAH